jgi:hypothetical protein
LPAVARCSDSYAPSLGLAASRRIAEALGLDLHIPIEIGRGSTFLATIATGELLTVDILQKPPEKIFGDVIQQDSASNGLAGLNILLVEG